MSSSSSSSDGEPDAVPAAAAVESPLDDFLSLVQSDSSLASLLFARSKSGNQSQQELLLKTCRHLFQKVESLASNLNRLEQEQESKDDDDEEEVPTLSGLTELYLGEEPSAVVDAETVWGQVDLQNEALHVLMKKSVRKLAKAVDGEEPIRILNLESEFLNDDDNDESEEEEEDNSDEEEEEEENSDGEDEIARRMRERMERTLDDLDEDGMDDDEEEEDEEEDSEEDDDEGLDTRFFGKKPASSKKKKKQSAPRVEEEARDDDSQDPAAQELNNGFFDIHDMEAFADEEEDMLPEQVWDPTPDDYDEKKKKEKNKKSFHQRQREGIEESGSDDDDDSDEDMLQQQSVKRKKYREDDEIEALFGMYKESEDAGMMDEGDDDEMEQAVNMTAADFFGAPNKKYFHKWKAKEETSKKEQKGKKNKSGNDEDDADSWDEFKFDDKDADWGGEGEEEEEEEESNEKPKTKAKKGEGNESGSSSDDDDGSSDSGSEDEDDDSDSDDDDGDKKPKAKSTSAKEPPPKSRHEKQSEKLQQETEQIEKEMMSEKPWQMTGETAATARPVNSLLEGTPEFSVASKMAPVITEEHTADLEEIIKQRILNEDWDDIVPRELPDITWHKKRGELPEVSQEKAKLGLGELYEREYLKKAVGYDVDAAEKESEEDKAKNEMKQLFANICSKLDALSNYHFAPRPVADEAEVRPSTTPAIAMEEILPLHVSDARGVAPEEVYEKKRGREGILRSETELEQTDRKRIRSGKKAARRKARQAKAADNKLIARVQPGLGLNNPYEKRKAREEVSMARAEGRITDGQADAKSGYGSSSKFFRQMQDEVSKAVRDGAPKEADQRKQSTKNRKSSSFKM